MTKITMTAGLCGLVGLLSLTAAHAMSSPADLIDAMDVDSADLVAGSIDTPAPSQPGMFDAPANLGGFTPVSGGSMALLFTGDVDTITSLTDHDWPDIDDHATLSFQLTVPAWANSFEFSFNFLSREYPEWVNSKYADTFEASADSDGYSGPIALDLDGGPVSLD